jgi:hypothetical protein
VIGGRWRRRREQPPHGLEQQLATLELINTEIAGRLTRQVDAGKSIDTKAAVLAGFAVTAAQFVAGREAQPVVVAFAFAAYLLAFGFAIAALRVGTYMDVPDPRELLDGYAMRSKAETLAELAAERVARFEENADKHDRKARRWQRGLAALTLALALSLWAMVQTGDRDPGAEPGRQQPANRGGTGQHLVD